MTEVAEENVVVVEGEEVEESPLPAVRHPVATLDEMTVDDLVAQVEKIRAAVKAVMQDGVHYGVIPGTKKPTLYKPGAQKLLLLFRFDPEYRVVERWHDDGHYTARSTCTLFHIPTGLRIGSGEGLCTTRESGYATRMARRTCPVCGSEAIIKGKAEYGGGWVCFAKKGGCGAKFADGLSEIEDQVLGMIDNPEIADTYNTVLKQAAKRSLTEAVLNATAASDVFTQDMEDMAANEAAASERAEQADGGKQRSSSGEKRSAPKVVKPEGWGVLIKEINEIVVDPANDTEVWLKLAATVTYRKDAAALSADEKVDLWKRSLQVWETLLPMRGKFPPPEKREVVAAWCVGFPELKSQVQAPPPQEPAEAVQEATVAPETPQDGVAAPEVAQGGEAAAKASEPLWENVAEADPVGGEFA